MDHRAAASAALGGLGEGVALWSVAGMPSVVGSPSVITDHR